MATRRNWDKMRRDARDARYRTLEWERKQHEAACKRTPRQRVKLPHLAENTWLPGEIPNDPRYA